MAKPKLKMLTPGTELYPIRAVSALTGVNSITLRAWERRYGLIKPVRTPKGHRLYTREDIDLIHKVTALLDKGVAISQVRAALGLRQEADTAKPATDPKATVAVKYSSPPCTIPPDALDNKVSWLMSCFCRLPSVPIRHSSVPEVGSVAWNHSAPSITLSQAIDDPADPGKISATRARERPIASKL